MKKTKVQLSALISAHPDKSYEELYRYITEKIEQGMLVPVKSAGNNARTPALPNAFWKLEEEVDYSDVYEELKFRIHPCIQTQYYRQHPERYKEDRQMLLLLSDYFQKHAELLEIPETMNERSFEIFHREKFFQKEGGLSFCKRLGISRDKLRFYETNEPISYYSHSKQTPQNILIIENLDTFYDIRRYRNAGHTTVLQMEFETLIYGSGKSICRKFNDYINGAEAYFMQENHLYYFGDLDYEGIGIYESLAGMEWQDGRRISIQLFTQAYERMLDKAQRIGIGELPDTKKGQNSKIGNVFLDFFDETRREQIRTILEAGKYIPQEILNEHDWG